jgi:hypothetical protein
MFLGRREGKTYCGRLNVVPVSFHDQVLVDAAAVAYRRINVQSGRLLYPENATDWMNVSQNAVDLILPQPIKQNAICTKTARRRDLDSQPANVPAPI